MEVLKRLQLRTGWFEPGLLVLVEVNMSPCTSANITHVRLGSLALGVQLKKYICPDTKSDKAQEFLEKTK